MFLSSFTLPIDYENDILDERAMHNSGKTVYFGGYVDNPYPCLVFTDRGIKEIFFNRITVLNGGNGSGKSTLLNLIARKLKLERIAPYNTGEVFDLYAEACEFKCGSDDAGNLLTIPTDSCVITSDDIFDYILNVRTNNAEIADNREEAHERWSELKYSDSIRFSGLEDYELLRQQILSRSRSVSRRKFVQRTAGKENILGSNGETVLEYFDTKLKPNTLYCLDEPENSLSPAMQSKLVTKLEEMTRFFGCQFIIATHSPFILAIEGATIYDLDSTPVKKRNWWELENVRTYYEFFRSHSEMFENADGEDFIPGNF